MYGKIFCDAEREIQVLNFGFLEKFYLVLL